MYFAHRLHQAPAAEQERSSLGGAEELPFDNRE